MLTDAFTKLRDSKAVGLIRAFIRSPWYLALNVFLMVCAELFSLELPVFYIYFAIILVVFLFDGDLLGVVVMVPCHYLAISAPNNSGRNAETLFNNPAQMTQLVILICLYAVLFIARLISLLLIEGRKKLPELTLGFLLFGASLLLGGAASGYWGQRTVLFGFTEIASFAAIYFFFYFTVNWKSVPKHYGLTVFLVLGVGVAVETVGMYFLPGAIVGSSVNRDALNTGWGIYNNVGCVMAVCMPTAFYFAITRKEGWIFTLLGITFYLATLLAQSRNVMLFGTAMFLACIIVVLVKSKGWERWKNLIAFGVFALAVLVAGLVFRARIEEFFRVIGAAGFNDSSRFDTYRACWKRFLEAPVFGSGFYRTPGTVLQDNGMWTTMDGAMESTRFLPPRAHNTLFQILASGGVFMLVAYLFHRVQTAILFYRRPSLEKTFLSLCVISLLLTSLLDCHFFNFGPGLLYSCLLLFAEGTNIERDVRSSFMDSVFRRRKKN